MSEDLMPKVGELDWSELKKTGKIEQCPISKQLGGNLNVETDYHKTGEKPTEEQLRKEAEFIMRGFDAQPTDEQLFGHLVPTEEELAKAQYEWENRINHQLSEPRKNIVPEEEQEHEWGNGRSFNDTLTRAEIEERNRHVG